MKMIKSINPTVIVLLGKSAARIFGKEAMRVGETINYNNTKMHFLYHPAYHLRNGRKGVEDLVNLKKLLCEEEQTKKQTSLGNFS